MTTFAKTSSTESPVRRRAPFRPIPHRPAPAAFPGGSILQRKPACPCDGGCPRCQPQENTRNIESNTLDTPASITGGFHASSELLGLRDKVRSQPIASVSYPMILPENERQSLIGSNQTAVLPKEGTGRPLSPSEELALGNADGVFDGVRVHDDHASRITAGLLGSAGFTIGNHIVLGEPAAAGRSREWLLAHEAAHTVQQHKQEGRAPTRNAEYEADAFADQVVARNAVKKGPSLGAASVGLAQKVISRTTKDLPSNLLLIVDVDDGDFVGGCVKAYVPHVGAKLIMKNVPKGAGNQIFNIHIGITTNAKGETCVFFYESVSGVCETTCYDSFDDLKKKLKEIQEWLKEKVKQVLEALAIGLAIVLIVILAYLIALALVTALGGILVLA